MSSFKCVSCNAEAEYISGGNSVCFAHRGRH